MCKYCEIPAAFTWEIVNDSEDIGSWELLFNENKFYGNGIREFVNVAKSLSKDERVVIFCKQMKWLVYLLQNHENLSTCDFKARGGKKGIDFFYLLLSDNVELRNWDNFWNKIDSTDNFIRRIGACREVFNYRKGELRKEPASLENHYNYTLAKEMWDDMTQQYYLYAPWATSFCEELAPINEEEMVWMEELDKAGFYYVNDDNFNEELYDVHCYDISSAFLSFLLRKKFPSTHFTYTDDDDEIQEIVSKKFYCWYGLFRFKKLQYREDVNFHIDLTRFGSPVEGGDMCEWDILFTNVDIEWFKEVFTWDDCYAIGIFYAEQKELNKNYALMFDELYENKDSQIKGTFAKEIHKFRAELPYGNPIKALDYATEVVYNAETNSYEEVEKEKPRSFKQKVAKLKQRGIPMYVSLWVAAYARLEFFTVWKGTNCRNYGDTDSVKFQGDENVEFINKHNKEIEDEFNAICRKRRTHYNGKIGKWLDEGKVDVMKQIGIKWYVTMKDGVIDVKASGANKDAIISYLNESKRPVNRFNIRMNVWGLMKSITYSKECNGIRVDYVNTIDKETRKELRGRKTTLYYFNPKEENINED